MICQIGIAPARPAEFVIVRVDRLAAKSTMRERTNMHTSREGPYAHFGFLVSTEDSLGQGGFGRVVGGFSEVTGLSMELDEVEYRESIDNLDHVRRFPGLHKFGVVTLKRGVIGDPDFLDWIGAMADDPAKPRRLRITILDQACNTVATFTLHNARPAIWVGSARLARGGGAVAIDELGLVHEGIERA